MSRALQVNTWLSRRQMERWLDSAQSVQNYEQRLAIFLIAHRCLPASEVAQMLLVNEKTIRRWIHDYNAYGPAALGQQRSGGRHRNLLTESEETALLASLRIRAEQGEFVTVTKIWEEIQAQTHRKISESYLLHLLHRHHWRKVVPRPAHPKADPQKVAQYKKDFPYLCEQINKRAGDLSLRVLFEDEATFGRISEIYSSWAPPHVRPTVPKQQIREYTHALCAIDPCAGSLVYSLNNELNHEVMGLFLRRIVDRFPGEYCVVFLDRSGPHIDRDLKIPGRMQVELIPSKSPELNPTEHVWDHIREKHFGNKLFPSMSSVIDELRHAFRLLNSTPEEILSMASFPWIVDSVSRVEKLSPLGVSKL